MPQNDGSDRYSIRELPGVMDRITRASLRRAGARLGNPMPATTAFTPPNGWSTTTSREEGCATLWDLRGRPRLKYYPEATFNRLVRDQNGNPVPSGDTVTLPWYKIIPRFEVQPDMRFSGYYVILDRVMNVHLSQGDGTPRWFNSATSAEEYLDNGYADWRQGKHWDDPEPKKWWQRLLFWR